MTKENRILTQSFFSQPTQKSLTPFIDIYELEDSVIVLADMPGISIEGTDIAVVKNQLTIRGRCAGRGDGSPLIRQCPRYDYYRAFKLSDAIDTQGIKAEMKDGVLTLTLPKKRTSQPVEVPISTVNGQTP